MALYQTQPDRKLRAKALAKEYGIGGHSHDFLDGSRGFVNHDWKGLEFDHYPEHQKITLKWAQVEQYIDLMIQSDRYLTDKEKEHYSPPAPVSTKPDADLPMADAILVDAPCSGLGILAKKPDIRYKTLEKARHDELLATQSAILDTAAAHLKEGGRLVYSTCTIDPAENEEQVRAFVGRHPEFRVVTPDVRFPAGMTVGDWGALSVPTRTGMDGFFLCAMQKRDS